MIIDQSNRKVFVITHQIPKSLSSLHLNTSFKTFRVTHIMKYRGFEERISERASLPDSIQAQEFNIDPVNMSELNCFTIMSRKSICSSFVIEMIIFRIKLLL